MDDHPIRWTGSTQTPRPADKQCTCKRCTICGGTGEIIVNDRIFGGDAFDKEPCEDCDAGIVEECDYCQEQRHRQHDPGPIPNAVEAMLRGDLDGIRAWLAHPCIGDGGVMNAIAIYLSDRLVESEKRVAFYERHTAKQANAIVERDIKLSVFGIPVTPDASMPEGTVRLQPPRESCFDCNGTGEDVDGDRYNGFERAICRSCDGKGYR